MQNGSVGEMAKQIVLINGGDCDFVERWIKLLIEEPAEDCAAWDQGGLGDCKQDHGERTNYKLRDQPFYMRGRNGKMRGY